jgi:modulator of FtsH protease HflC
MLKILTIPIIIIALFVLSQSLYIVNQVEQSVELRFGEPIDVEQKPGLKFKTPFVVEVKFFDNRLLDLNADPKEVIAADQKRLIVDAFAKYKIIDPLKFYQTVRDERRARNRLNSILDSSLRQVIGGVKLTDVLQEGRRASIMEDIRNILNKEAQSFGIDVIDVRIMRADLPETNSFAIFSRMQTEREREAKEFRAQGEEESEKIKAKADREKVEIVAKARKSSEIIKGEGEGRSTRIFARSFGQDISFYEFYRSLEAYRASLANESSKILLSPQSDFFKHFRKLRGVAR